MSTDLRRIVSLLQQKQLSAAVQAESAKERIQRAFGEGVVSQKPLDEVVLEYLVESARKRKRSSK